MAFPQLAPKAPLAEGRSNRHAVLVNVHAGRTAANAAIPLPFRQACRAPPVRATNSMSRSRRAGDGTIACLDRAGHRSRPQSSARHVRHRANENPDHVVKKPVSLHDNGHDPWVSPPRTTSTMGECSDGVGTTIGRGAERCEVVDADRRTRFQRQKSKVDGVHAPGTVAPVRIPQPDRPAVAIAIAPWTVRRNGGEASRDRASKANRARLPVGAG